MHTGRMRYDNKYVSATISNGPLGLHIVGSVIEPQNYDRIELFAANPINQMTSYSGSGLPFPCAAIAFDNTPNFASINPGDGMFDLYFTMPNSYYSQDAKTKIPASVFVLLHRSGAEPIFVHLALPEDAAGSAAALTLRTLTHRPTRTGPEFYAAKSDLIDVGTAEDTMRAMAFAKGAYGIA